MTINSVHLPTSGRIPCSRCHTCDIEFDRTRTESEGWRITANPLAWGNSIPEILVLGFSKGQTQSGELDRLAHDQIAFRKGRTNMRKILNHIGLVDPDENMDRLIADRAGRFGWGSLIRCSGERKDGDQWKGSGGGMLDRFVKTKFGRSVAGNCTGRFLGQLPSATRLVILFGLGTRLAYVKAAEGLIRTARLRNDWRRYNEISYGDGQVTFVHVEHFSSQGSLIPDWLGIPGKSGKISERAKYGKLARAAIDSAFPPRTSSV